MVNKIDSNEIFTDLYGDQLNNVVVFGNPDNTKDFEAHVRMEFWGEDNIQLYDEGIKGIPTLDGEKLKLDLPDKSIEWRKSGNALKWIITLKKKPATNKYSFKLGGNWRDFNFGYQRPLAKAFPEATIEYFDKNGVPWIRAIHPPGVPMVYCERPLNVEGSYAVTHKIKRDHILGQMDYSTGKVLHIPRPQVVDAIGKSEWVSLHIENGIYTGTIPQKFLDEAVYPVIINDEFGYTDVGGSDGLSSADYVNACGPFSPAADGSATAIALYTSESAGKKITLGFWNDTGATYPKDRQRDTAELDTLDPDWTSGSLDSAIDVSAATLYWLGFNQATTDSHHYWDTGQTGKKWKYKSQAYSAGTLVTPYPAGAAEYDEYLFSIKITYTPSAGVVLFRRRREEC